jgi:peptidoglycan/xylan/chitin deacetylase (PgdA/CDA1 family)
VRKLWPLLFSASLSLSAWGLSCNLLGHQELGRELLQELSKSPTDCRAKAVHLTFDDGPGAPTAAIMDELKRRNVAATFFITTTTIDSSHPRHQHHRALLTRQLNEGHLIASHGHEHRAYDLRMNAAGEVLERGLSPEEQSREARRSVELLNAATAGKFSQQRPLLYRFPYGRGAMPSQVELEELRRQGKVVLSKNTYAGQLQEYRQQSSPLQAVAGENFSHLGWNHDSRDSSFGTNLPDVSVQKKYILDNLRGMCNGNEALKVALFHDIKQINTVAIPLLIDLGRCLGLNFIGPKEMERQRESLVNSGVYIPKENIRKGPVESMLQGLSAVANVGQINRDKDCGTHQPQTCFSQQYQRSYEHCTGGNSICLDGRWVARQDPLVAASCPLPAAR